MKGNELSNYYSEVGSYGGAIKFKGRWTAVKDLNRIDKQKMYRWQGPPSKAIVNAMKDKPIRADVLFPELAVDKRRRQA